MRENAIFLAGAMLLMAWSAQANSDGAEVLPKKVYRLQFTGVFTGEVVDEYNSSGNIQALGKSLNRTVTTSDFAKSEPRLQSLVNALNNLSPNMGNELVSANLFSDIRAKQERYLGVLSYGLSKRMMASVVVPTIKRTVTAELNASSVNNAQVVSDAVGELSPEISNGLNELAGQNMDGEFFKEQIFRSKGYKFNENYSATDIGDIELRLLYRYFYGQTQSHSLGVTATLPTGTTAPIDNVFDPGSGRGKWTLGVASHNQFYINRLRQTSLSLKNGISYSLAEKRDRAVPLDEDDTLPSLLPEDGQVQPTTELSQPKFESSATFVTSFFQKSVIFESAVNFQAKGASKITGPGQLYYQRLEEESEEKKLEAQLSLGYSSVNSFMQKKSKVPFEFFVHYNRVLSGKNVPITDYIRTDLVLFLK